MKSTKYTTFFKENFTQFLLVFVSVVLAFFLAEWSRARGEKLSEEKLLIEIKNGINSDYADFTNNINGHTYSLKGIQLFRNWINNQPISNDAQKMEHSDFSHRMPHILITLNFKKFK